MWLIEFSELNFKLLIILIYPVSLVIETFAKQLYISEDNSLFLAFRYFISYMFFGIIWLITRHKNKSNIIIPSELIEVNEDIKKQKTTTSLLNNEIFNLKKKLKKKRKIKSFIFLLILSAINLFCYVYIFLFEKTKYEFAKQSIGVFFFIGFYSLLSFLILKQKFYKHHFVSLIVIAIILLILFIISIFYTDKNNILHSFLYYIIFTFDFSLFNTLGKKYFNDYYNTPYFMLFIVGTINAFLLLLYDIFAYYFNKDISGVIIGFQKNIKNISDVFEFILDLILDFILNLGIQLTIYYFSPCHYFISEYCVQYINYLINSRKSNEDFYSNINIMIFSIAFFINFFWCLVFNEVIILNFWNLDYNTKKRIKERMKIDDAVLTDESEYQITFDEDNEIE